MSNLTSHETTAPSVVVGVVIPVNFDEQGVTLQVNCTIENGLVKEVLFVMDDYGNTSNYCDWVTPEYMNQYATDAIQQKLNPIESQNDGEPLPF